MLYIRIHIYIYIVYYTYTVSFIYTHITLYIYLYLLYLPIFLHSLLQGISKCQHKHFVPTMTGEANIAGWKSPTFQKQNNIKSLVYWSVLLMIPVLILNQCLWWFLIVTVLADIFVTLFLGVRRSLQLSCLLHNIFLWSKHAQKKVSMDSTEPSRNSPQRLGKFDFFCRWCINPFEDH